MMLLANADVEPLPNGLIVNRHSESKLIAAEHEVLIIIQQPEWPPQIDDMIYRLKADITDLPNGDAFTIHDKEVWLKRLGRLHSNLLKVQVRRKRGFFNFIGSASKTLFGTATNEDVENIRKILRNMQHTGATTTHRVNELLLVVNHSNTDIQLNRDRLNLVNKQVTKMSAKMEDISRRQNQLDNENLKLKRHLMLDRSLGQLEREVHEIHQDEDSYQTKKEHLENDKLTEEILPPAQLQSILATTLTEGMKIVTPLEWYYENCKVQPIWTGEHLVYRVKLPLTKPTNYMLYEFKALPFPSHHANVTQKLQVKQWYLEEPMTGKYVEVSNCVGHKPVLCYGNLVHTNQATCEHALVNGDREKASSCSLLLMKQSDKVQQLSINSIGLTTNGEKFVTRCSNGHTTSKVVTRGAYLVTVPQNCVITGRNWRLTAIAESKDEVTIPKRHFVISPLSLENLTQNHVIKFINDYKKVPDLAPVRMINLKPLQEQDPVLSEIDFIDDMSFTFIDLILLLLLIPPYLLCIQYIYFHCKGKCKKVKKASAPELEPLAEKHVEYTSSSDVKTASLVYPTLPPTQTLSESKVMYDPKSKCVDICMPGSV